MKHILAILTLLFLAASVFAADVVTVAAQSAADISGAASAIQDAIKFAQSHPVVSTALGGWATHSEVAPFVKRWKHDGTLQLGWKIVQAVLGVLAQKRK